MRTSEFKQSEGGLYLPMHATLKGRVRWQVLDERGVPEIPRTPSGIPVGPVEGVEQDNLITDLGMDQMATVSIRTLATAGAGWRRYLAVGTGSTPPNVADTTLDAEAQRANSSGTFPTGTENSGFDGDNDYFWSEWMVTRLVTMSTDRNLTEFGFSPDAAGNIGIRELLRDGGGNPITVSLLNGKSLRVDHTARVEIAAPENGTAAAITIDEYDAGNNLVQSLPYDITYGPMVRTPSDSSHTNLIFRMWDPPETNFIQGSPVYYYTSPKTYARTGVSAIQDATVINSLSVSAAAYAPGSHVRAKRATLSTGQGNAAWYGFAYGVASWLSGWVAVFDDPSSYTKQNTDTLRVGFVSSWARA